MAHKILVVDDTVDTRDLLHLYLTKAGFTVIIAGDGGEGLYRAKAERPSLIITDINMPRLDGISMIRELRAEEETAAVPVIALTAYGREFREEAVRVGANAAKEKPFNFEELISQVWSLLGQA
ncbi:MAG TPA: response regulator [Pyrinomonadaceae bacterium]|nr:response regulator [Pyrinomonadaceae bacterium]